MIEILGMEPVKVHRNRPLTLIGRPTSDDRGRPAYRSGLERDFYLLAIRHRCIATIDYEPLVVRYRIDGVLRRYTPDYRIRFRAETPRPAWLGPDCPTATIYEVKPSRRLSPDPCRWPPALRAGQRAALQAAMGFLVMFDHTIRYAQAAAAAAWADPILRGRLLSLEATRVRALLDSGSVHSVADLAACIDLPSEAYAKHLDARVFCRDVFRGTGAMSPSTPDGA